MLCAQQSKGKDRLLPPEKHLLKQRATHRRRLRRAERYLQDVESPIGEWIEESGRCQLEIAWDRSLYEALVRAIAHQQLHGRAAETILGRLIEAFHRPQQTFPTPLQLARAQPERLRACGFSAAKVAAIQGIARATHREQIPTRNQADQLNDEELIEKLLPLRGVGRWTVEMLLIFTLGRLDVMPVDDFGVRSGLKHLYQFERTPSKFDFAELTDRWAPYRSVGAWYLWRLADARKLS